MPRRRSPPGRIRQSPEFSGASSPRSAAGGGGSKRPPYPHPSRLHSRNICVRGHGNERRLCAYDWELATLGAPQRDLAELLTFVLLPDATRAEAQHWIDLHRTALQDETGGRIDYGHWLNGFRAGLYDLMLNRLPMYALIHRVRQQPFLPRVVRTWRRLYHHFPLELL